MSSALLYGTDNLCKLGCGTGLVNLCNEIIMRAQQKLGNIVPCAAFSTFNAPFAGEKAASYIPGTEANREKKDNQAYGNTGYGSSTGTGTGYGSSNNTTGYNSSGTGTGTGYNSSGTGTGTGYGSNTSGTGTGYNSSGTGTGYGSNTSGTAGMTTGTFASCTCIMLHDNVLTGLDSAAL